VASGNPEIFLTTHIKIRQLTGTMRAIIVVLLLLLTACAKNIPIETGPPIESYFCLRDNCTAMLANLINNADDAKCALYDVSQPEILHALKKADWKAEDGKSPLMHNKFCIINQSMVWTGSWNPTKTTRANNAVIIHSKTLSRNYLDEYSELPGGFRHVIHPKVSYNGIIIENYFCPEDRCKEHVLEQLKSAKQEIVFMLADLTDKDIISQLQRTDIFVKGVIDKSEKEAIAQIPFTALGSIHHKVFIVDKSTVITGSYNPTRNGNEYNDENILIIHDLNTAKKFLDEFTLLTGVSSAAP
jgi:phosphatidylserine/phosphatidylglycerophosphate/cardiolipin synthase-like enzyme